MPPFELPAGHGLRVTEKRARVGLWLLECCRSVIPGLTTQGSQVLTRFLENDHFIFKLVVMKLYKSGG